MLTKINLMKPKFAKLIRDFVFQPKYGMPSFNGAYTPRHVHESK